jgi:hypothetical protein
MRLIVISFNEEKIDSICLTIMNITEINIEKTTMWHDIPEFTTIMDIIPLLKNAVSIVQSF